ncbi:hypothetical protein [Psychrobacillus sp. NPDC096389]|uniref:hypothetical protein n=1 Tax=Psychrobacillus sp. NPDC096389 TaxID=3364490 RepID=UPI00381F63ED
MRVFLESAIILVIFAFVSSIWVIFFGSIYLEIGIDIERYGWTPYVSILILFLVLYRNKLQFSGRNKGKDREKLPKLISTILIFTAISLLFLPLVLSFFFN